MENPNLESEPVIGVYSPVIMRWSSVFGGWIVATGIAFLLYMGGLSLGFSAFDPHNANEVAKGIGTGAGIWIGLTWIVSLFLGAMFASWFDGRSDATIGALHGITVWALYVTVSGLLLSVGAMQFAQRGAMFIHGGMNAGDETAFAATSPHDSMNISSTDVLIGLRADIIQRIRQTNEQASSVKNGRPDVTWLDRETAAAVAIALVKDDAQNARDLLAAGTTMSPTEIDQTLQGVTGKVEKAKVDIRAAADNAARYIARATCTLFLSIFFGLVFAAAGGWVGADHITRVHHLRRYK